MTRTPRKTKAGPTLPPSSSSALEDRATAYARAVVAGELPAGPHVRGACKRHLKDIREQNATGLYWDVEASERVIRYFRTVLTVLKNSKVVPFELLAWQAFIVGSLFGWKRRPNDVELAEYDLPAGSMIRRFSTAYVETAKGSGKSPLAAGIGHYMLLSDGEAAAEVYAAATKKDQAMILFNDAVAMRKNSPALRDKLIPSGVNPVYKLTHYASGSFFKPISNDDGQSGPRPYCALVDELHEHKDRSTVTMLEAGFKFRLSPLLFLITNSGSDKRTICGEYHDHAVAVCAGDRVDESLFAYVCALDEGDDPLADESCWGKANPSLGATIKKDYLRRQVATAKALPGNQNTVLRLNFCMWTDSDTAWISREAWTKCEVDDVELEDFLGAEGYGGIDLSFAKDLTAHAAVFPEGDKLFAFVDFWTPLDTIQAREEKDRVPYSLWAALPPHDDKRRYLNATPGKIVKLEQLAHRMAYMARNFDWRGTAFDSYREKELVEDLDDLNMSDVAELMHEHPQGFRRAKLYDARGRPVKEADGTAAENPLWMPASVEELENAILEERLFVKVNPVLRWNVGSAVARADPAGTGGKVFSKLKATGRIDGLVALAMAVGLAKARQIKRKSLDGFLSNPVVAK